MGQLNQNLARIDIDRGMRDAQLVATGQISRDALPADRRANLEQLEKLDVDPTLVRDGINKFEPLAKETNELMDKVMSETNRDMTGAMAWGSAVVAIKTTDGLANFASKTNSLVGVFGRVWTSARGAGEAMYKLGETAGKYENTVRDFLGGTAAPAGGGAAPGGAGPGGAPVAGAGAGPGAGGGAGAGTPPPSGFKVTDDGVKLANTFVKGGKSLEGLDKAMKQAEIAIDTRNYRPPAPKAPTPVSGYDRFGAMVSYRDNVEKSYQAYAKGKTLEGYGYSVEGLGNVATLGGDKKMGERLGGIGKSIGNLSKAIDAEDNWQRTRYGLQAGGNAVGVVDKNIGQGISDIGEAVGYAGEVKDLYGMWSNNRRIADNARMSVEERLRRLREFQRWQEWRMRLGDGSVQGIPLGPLPGGRMP